MCEGVDEPKDDLQYLYYFCGSDTNDEEMEEAYQSSREIISFSKLLGCSFTEAKPYLSDELSSIEIQEYEKR